MPQSPHLLRPRWAEALGRLLVFPCVVQWAFRVRSRVGESINWQFCPNPDCGRLTVQLFTALSIDYECHFICKAYQYALKPMTTASFVRTSLEHK